MTLFGLIKEGRVHRLINQVNRRLDAGDVDRRRLKGNLDKLGAQLTDLECKVKILEGGKCNGKKHK